MATRATRVNRISLSLLSLLLAIALIACDGSNDPAAETSTTAPDAESPAPDAAAEADTVLRAWAIVTDQRRDVIEVDVATAHAVLAGEIDDWSLLGGAAQPLHVYLAAGDAAPVGQMLDLAPDALAAERLEDHDAVRARVAAEPGAVGLLPATALRPGVLALIVDGHDPYRDAAADSPLRLMGTAAEAATIDAPFDATFDPVQVVATGELIPARCTNQALEAAGDHGAAFDAVGDYLRAAELAVSALEVPLTDLAEPTPCVETFVLQGDARFADAIAEAGLDVVMAIGNHMLDCWGGGCAPGAVLTDTLDRLDRGGVVAVGAGPDLAAASAPRLVTVEQQAGGGGQPVTFAFLGYDSISPWNHASAGSPGVAPMEATAIAADVRAATALADHVIVGMNWGIEYQSDPSLFQREQAQNVIDAGATMIIGNHPHWVQAVEQRGDALVTYALGNFVFDQDWSVETTQSVVIETGFTAERLIGYRLRPVVLRGDPELRRGLFRPEFVAPTGEGRPIMDRIWDASARLQP